MSEFARHPAFDIARRLEIRGQDSFSWLVILGDSHDITQIEEIADEVRLVGDTKARIVNAHPFNLEELRQQLRQSAEDVVFLLGLDQASDGDWAVLDVNRSAIERPGAIIFWLSLESIARLNSQAPNLRSFIGGSIFILSENGGMLTEPEREQRLAELEIQYGLSGHAILNLAREGQLPTEPDFAEWLVLLGRGDLL
jgi:hypothetical protein